MSLSLNELLRLSEAASGFNGGSNVDEYPHMTLEECASALPKFILENQISLYESTARLNERAVDLTMDALRTGVIDESAVAELNELSFNDVWVKIKAFFAKIKKFLQSIIAKVTLQIDKIKMSGAQLWSKYGKSTALNNDSKFKDLTYNGYNFLSNVKWADTVDPDELIVKVAYAGTGIKAPSEVQGAIRDMIRDNKVTLTMKNAAGGTTSYSGTDTRKADESEDDQTVRMKEKATEEYLKPFDELEKSKVAANVARYLTGMSSSDVSDESWKDDIRKALLDGGEKKEITYGEGSFTKSAIEANCKASDGLVKIKDLYTKLKAAVDKSERDMDKQMKDYTAQIKDNVSKDQKGTHYESASNAAVSMVSSYYSKYLEAYQTTTSTITEIQSIRLGVENLKINQAKGMLVKLINAGSKKSKAEDVSVEEDDLLDIDWE